MFLSFPEPPELLLEMGMPRELKAMAGTLIKIVAGIKGQPFPKVTWKKNDAELPPRVEIETSVVRSKLEMRYCNRGDCGDYTLTIENPAGCKSATCTVLVLGNHFLNNSRVQHAEYIYIYKYNYLYSYKLNYELQLYT